MVNLTRNNAHCCRLVIYLRQSNILILSALQVDFRKIREIKIPRTREKNEEITEVIVMHLLLAAVTTLCRIQCGVAEVCTLPSVVG